uniref:Catechol 2,3-dioxygenase n=1 Tax=Candidatus Kentrum sp. TUN TaxID=2126343 RepID=A0A451A699_9GAMM|nr:MAG: Catechol 2,3-dioxygenase [Candidatus Kentron sp. TUN]VFK53966.1 MAG: Catechol 2,3-dioxygenase [Candidatus Kentron sp. TUN]VFK61511.1 MAG: Catechol 2,3-dioxygenase [Candidatus Kentron sp. TUN]
MLHKIDHINIVVTDMARSIRFYTELLGFQLTKQAYVEGDWVETVVGLPDVQADVAYLVLPDGPRLELMQYNAPVGTARKENSLPNTVGLRHVAFQVTDIDAIVKRLRMEKIDVLSSPASVPASTVSHQEGAKWFCYLRDPDGVILELAEYR